MKAWWSSYYIYMSRTGLSDHCHRWWAAQKDKQLVWKTLKARENNFVHIQEPDSVCVWLKSDVSFSKYRCWKRGILKSGCPYIRANTVLWMGAQCSRATSYNLSSYWRMFKPDSRFQLASSNCAGQRSPDAVTQIFFFKKREKTKINNDVWDVSSSWSLPLIRVLFFCVCVNVQIKV